jgi:glycosyltransferase involved in cell wall biosynthesis
VVVPTVGRASIERCLEALGRQTLRPLEVVVVEDAGRRGPSWARNEGIRRAAGDWIAFTDDDCAPPPDWLDRLAGAAARFGGDAVGGNKEETDPRLRFLAAPGAFPGEEGIDRAGVVHDAANLMIRRPALESLASRDGHAFDERLRISEDVDLAWRIRRRGAVVVWSTVRVVHHKKLSLSGYLGFRYRQGWGSGVFQRIQQAAVDAGDLAPGVDPPARRGAFEKAGRILRHRVIGPFDGFGHAPLPVALAHWLGGKADAAGSVAGYLLGRPPGRG